MVVSLKSHNMVVIMAPVTLIRKWAPYTAQILHVSSNFMDKMILVWPESSNCPAFLLRGSFQESQLLHNNEIWSTGYIANRAELISQYGLSQQTSDREILYCLYEHMGDAEGIARMLAGTCTWLIWEAGRQKLTLISDHSGLEPIYFSRHEGCLWVSNDLELILRHSGLPRRANPAAVVAWLSGMPMPSNQTLFEDIFVLSPGTIRIYTRGETRQVRYWQPQMQPTLHLKDDREYAEALRALLVKIVDQHVPGEDFALTLSSGMDSSSIAGALRLARPKERISSLGWIMPDFPSPINEEERIRATSAKLNLDLTVIQADQYWPLKPMELPTPLPILGFYQEAWIATFQEMNRQGWQTLITGAPGDVCFGNFISSYPDLLISLRWVELFKQIRHGIESGYHKTTDWKTPLRLVFKPLLLYLKGGQTVPSTRAPTWLHPSKRDLYEQLKQDCRPPRRLGLPARVERLRQVRYPGAVQHLIQCRELANHFKIEMRDPLFDHRILEFALSLPAEQTYCAGMQKYILRNSMRGTLPDAVVDLRLKILPLRLYHRGLRERSIEQAKALLTNMRLAELDYVLPDVLQNIYKTYLDGKTDRSDFFIALMLESQIRTWT